MKTLKTIANVKGRESFGTSRSSAEGARACSQSGLVEEESSGGRGVRRGEAEACPRTANQGAARDAGAIARPGACCAAAPARLVTFAAYVINWIITCITGRKPEPARTGKITAG
jgi:hypothetical protein